MRKSIKLASASYVAHLAYSEKMNVVSTMLRVVDQTPSLVNHVNKFGWPMTDIELLMKANDEMERSALAARLQELDLNSPAVFNNLSDEQKILLLKPCWVQTPAELERFTTQQTEYLQYKMQKEKAAKLLETANTTITQQESTSESSPSESTI